NLSIFRLDVDVDLTAGNVFQADNSLGRLADSGYGVSGYLEFSVSGVDAYPGTGGYHDDFAVLQLDDTTSGCSESGSCIADDHGSVAALEEKRLAGGRHIPALRVIAVVGCGASSSHHCWGAGHRLNRRCCGKSAVLVLGCVGGQCSAVRRNCVCQR